jgi:hypothetical protein
MKKVALIQSKEFFTKELNEKYLDNILLLTSNDVVAIYKFIMNNAKKNCIYNYVLHVDSGVLSNFIDYIAIKKKKCFCAKLLLDRCIFVATYSNADSVREKNIQKNTNIYFALSPLSEIIKSYLGYPPNRAMLVVSDKNNPYYNQQYDSDIIPKYRISELTVDKINRFANTANIMIVALDTLEETKTFTELLLQSNYSQIIAQIEVVAVEEMLRLENKVSSFFIRSSGTGIWGNTDKYAGLNIFNGYEICATVLVNTYKLWNEYIKNHVISIQGPKLNVSCTFFFN